MTKVSKKSQTKQSCKTGVRRSVTITLPLDIAETLQALIDGSIGTSDNDDFNEQMAIVLNKLDKAVSKHYA